MIRNFNEYYVLDTEGTTYAFRVSPVGQPEHLYYGRKICVNGPEELAALVEKRVFEPGNAIRYYNKDVTVIPEDTCYEVSAFGHGDLRDPFVEIVHADGCRTSDLLFKSAEIRAGREPLATLPCSYSEDGETECLHVVLEDAYYGETLEIDYCVYPECDVITRIAKLTNTGDAEIELERLMSGMLDLPESGLSVTSFHGAWAREMDRSAARVDAGKFVIESRAGYTSNRANPFFMVHDPAATETSGDCYGFNLVYSGNHYASVGVNAYGKTRVVNGINPQGFRFILAPGESFEAPESVMTFSPEGFGGQSLNMHRFVREHIVRGEWKNRERPILLNSWEAAYFKISERSLVSLAKAGKEVGIELFVMDDGWFGERSDDSHSLGDWDPDKKKLPHGLEGLAKKINALGLDLGIWVEPEMVSRESDLYREHPDWAVEVPGKPQSEGRNQRILDLVNPAVREYVTEKMSGVFTKSNAAYVKWDMNRVFSDVYSQYLPKERQGETAHRMICGLYAVWKELTARFPHILFEGCASGGNRFDLATLCFFPQIWGSDNTDAGSRAHIQEGYSYGYPLSCVGAHISSSPNHQTLRDTPLDTRFNVASFGLLGYEYDLRDLNAEKKKKLIDQTQLYKKWRGVLQKGDFYRVEQGNVHQWICVSPDKKKAVALMMQESVVPNTQYHLFKARGLDPETVYRFSNVPRSVNVKRFGTLVNTIAPIHVKQDSIIHGIIDRIVKMPGEKEDVVCTGDVMMNSGIKLKQAFSGTGYNDEVRFFADFFSRLYFIEAEDQQKPDA